MMWHSSCELHGGVQLGGLPRRHPARHHGDCRGPGRAGGLHHHRHPAPGGQGGQHRGPGLSSGCAGEGGNPQIFSYSCWYLHMLGNWEALPGRNGSACHGCHWEAGEQEMKPITVCVDMLLYYLNIIWKNIIKVCISISLQMWSINSQLEVMLLMLN